MREQVSFFWNGRRMLGRAGDTIAAALWREGVLALGCSRKRHRPLGYSGTYIQGELLQVEGVPHVRASTCALREGLDVRSQNVWPSARFDLLRFARLIPPRWLRGGFERSRLFPGGSRRFALWERFLMVMAGEASIAPQPERWTATVPAAVVREVDTAVVGGGPAGRAAANAAVRRGERTVLVSRSAEPGRDAAELGAELSKLDARVSLLPAHQAVGLYRAGTLLLAAPCEGHAAAQLIRARRIMLAVGKRSLGPWIRGHDLPGVLDLHAGLDLARQIAAQLGPVAVVGTGAQSALAAALRRRGVSIAACEPLEALVGIAGHRRVTGVRLKDGFVRCRALVHAGPWASDPSLAFQAAALGAERLQAGPLPSCVELVGSAAEPDELVTLHGEPHPSLCVCPCMDVTVGEIYGHLRAGESHVEVLKRATGCGMGPCQGFPCWRLLEALLRHVRPELPADSPTFRPPRAGLTVQQAAGLDGRVSLD